MTRPLEGLLVVSLEQAVAAPYCSCRLADAGARVIKLERAEGDFARAYDRAAKGESAYFVWLNRGKESIAARPEDAGRSGAGPAHDRPGRRLHSEPGAGRRAATGPGARIPTLLRRADPRLITCDDLRLRRERALRAR